jgi:kynurenine formamidase
MKINRIRLCLSLMAALPAVVLSADSSLTKAHVEKLMKEISNWGRWGPNDQLGTVNLITPEKRKQAAALIRDGISVSMSRNTSSLAEDDSPPFEQKLLSHGDTPGASGANDAISVAYHGFTVTHLDALCHLFHNGKMYNSYSQKEVKATGAGRLAVLNLKDGIFTKAVLMDMPRLLGVRFLAGDRRIYPADLEAWERKAGVRAGKGDAILIRTGRPVRRATQGPWKIMENSAGLDVSCMKWLKERDVAVIGSDLALDALPSGSAEVQLPVHLLSIVAMGMPILDNCDFEAVSEAAAHRKRWEFALSVAPLAVSGGTGSPVNPLAMF